MAANLARLEALLARVPDYHMRIMNSGHTMHLDVEQKLAARDARHAAAEIASEAEVHIDALRAALRDLLPVIRERDALREALRRACETGLGLADAYADQIGKRRHDGWSHIRQARAELCALPDMANRALANLTGGRDR